VSATVHLKGIVEALEIQFDERSAFLDRDTGEVHTVSTDLLHQVEEYADDEKPDLSEWQYPEWEIAKQVVFEFGVRFLKLPTKYEVHEWAIMEDSPTRWSPVGFAQIFCMPSTAEGRFGCSRTRFGVTASSLPGLPSATRH
jgi:hypothetical protein